MSDLQKQKEVRDCFDALKPFLDEIGRLTKVAPLDARGRAGLTMLCATHLFGHLCGAIDEADGKPLGELRIETAREATGLLLAALERGGESRQ